MLNHITIMGRLTREPELRRTGSGNAVTNFAVAVERDFSTEKETDFFECVAWKATAEFISKYFSKGRMIVIDGHLQNRKWTDKDGKKRQTTEIVAERIYFGDSKKEESSGNAQGGYNNQGAYNPAGGGYGGYSAPASDFAMLDDDDGQLPF